MGGVAGHPVQGLLDGQDVLVLGGLLDELHHAVEALVGVVDQPVLLPDGGEQVVIAPEVRHRHGDDGLEAQVLAALDPGELGEESQVQGAGHGVNLVFLDLEHVHQELPHVLVALLQDLQAHRAAPLPALDGLLHLAHKVLRFLVDLQVGVSGDAEGAGGLDLVELEELVKLIDDDVLQQG